MSGITRRDRSYIRTGLADDLAADHLLNHVENVLSTTTGNVKYVDSGAGVDSGNGDTSGSPFATLDYAVGQCTANNGDVIVLMPGHAETITADSGVDIDVAGITVLGLGYGGDRPTFTFTTAVTADFKLAAASTVVSNVLFLGGIDATTGVIEVSAADCALLNTEYRDSTGQATDVIVTTADADRLLIDGHRHIGAAADGGDTAIVVVGCDDVTIRNCEFYGNFDLGAIECRTTAAVRLRVHDIQVWNAGAEDLVLKDTVTASTGIIGPNIQMVLADNAANITEALTGATFHYIGDGLNVVNLAGEQSMAWNATASTDA